MAPTRVQMQLISEYEPALYFNGFPGQAGSERFFPSDAKRYLEHAALYLGPHASAATTGEWGAPVVAKGKLLATAGGNGTFIGEPDGSTSPNHPYLETTPDKEHFLEVSGWRSASRFADLDALAAMYANDPALKDSRFWYHAEVFDKQRLATLWDIPGLTFNDLLQPQAGKPPVLSDPVLICYYLFYPGHDESLGGCTDSNGNLLDSARDFGSFAGEWSCIAILFDRPANSTDPYKPKWVGLTNRNTGAIDIGAGEIRSTMRLLPWSSMQTYENTHPRLTVALGNHGLYIPGEAIIPPTFDDDAARNCGAAAPIVDPGDEYGPPTLWPEVLFLKFAAGNAVGGLLGGFAGLAWGIAEVNDASHLEHISLGDPSYRPNPDATSINGFVVYPAGKPPPGVTPGNPALAVEWKSDIVDRTTQVLWGEDPAGHGYTGRWGPRVEQDPRARRSGMTFPKFWHLFFDTLVRNDPPSRTIVLTESSGTPWIVPDDWNNANNTIELIGGGGGGSAGEFPGKSGAGGGGGAYIQSSNVVLTSGAISFTIGAAGKGGETAGSAGGAGGDTIFNGGAMVAKGGAGGVTGNMPTGGAGGSADQSVGTKKFSGGNGGGSDPGPNGAAGGGGGGGAGGPNGVGGTGGTAVFDGATPGGGAGGGGNGGGSGGLGVLSATIGGNGGNDASLTGSGAGSTDQASAGKAGTSGGGGGGGFSSKNPGNPTTRGGDGGDGVDMAPVGGGGGGGGGGSGSDSFDGSSGGEGGDYGAGGGGGGRKGVAAVNSGLGAKGAPGVIRITYTP